MIEKFLVSTVNKKEIDLRDWALNIIVQSQQVNFQHTFE